MTDAKVNLLLQSETWEDGLTSDVRLAEFYRNSALKGTATTLLCTELLQHVKNRKLDRNSIIVLEADFSRQGLLERFYEKLGFKMHQRYPLDPDDIKQQPEAKAGGLMKSTVGEVLQSCVNRLAAHTQRSPPVTRPSPPVTEDQHKSKKHKSFYR